MTQPRDDLKRVALVIGVNAYSGGIAPLQSAVPDAKAIAAKLEKEHGYSVKTIIDEKATREAIEAHVADVLPTTLSDQSAFLLYFGGHGVAVGDGTEDPNGYLLPFDARPSDEESWVSMETLHHNLMALPCRHLFVILDCCFAGSFRWSSSRAFGRVSKRLYDSQYARYLNGKAWQALTSAAHNQRAADLTPGKRNERDGTGPDAHSPFAAALMRGLSGDADSSRGGYEPDGVITATELYQYVFEDLVPNDSDATQTPGIWPLKKDNDGEFIFLNPTSKLNTAPDPPLDDKNNPWLGLSAYSDKESHLLFGRRDVIEKMLTQVLDRDTPGFVAVVGASGTGKSSAVKAGLLPLLENPPEDRLQRIGKWRVVLAARLRGDPNRQLDGALREASGIAEDTRCVILFDQFEELYTQCPDAGDRGRFLERLGKLVSDATSPIIMLTIRTDFEPRLAAEPPVRALWKKAKFLVDPFTQEELRECIVGPANVKAVFFEPVGIIDQLLEQTLAMPGALPLLSFALAEMYRNAQRRREMGDVDRALTQDDYDKTGGVVGSLHRRASALFNDSPADEQEVIQRVFLRFVSQSGAKVTRRRVSFDELSYSTGEEQQRVDRIVDRFINARLLVSDGDYVEPAHDTLIVAWQNVQDWLTESGPQDLIRAAWSQARSWRSHDHMAGYLWNKDPRLPQLVDKLVELNALERRFARASTKKRTMNFTLSIGAVAAIVAIVSFATWYSVGKDQETRHQAALSQWDDAVVARDTLNNPITAQHYFARAASSPDPNIADASRQAAAMLNRSTRLKHVFALARESVIDVRPDGGRFLVLDPETNEAQQYDTYAGVAIAHESIQVGVGGFAYYFGDGGQIAVENELGIVNLYDADTGLSMPSLAEFSIDRVHYAETTRAPGRWDLSSLSTKEREIFKHWSVLLPFWETRNRQGNEAVEEYIYDIKSTAAGLVALSYAENEVDESSVLNIWILDENNTLRLANSYNGRPLNVALLADDGRTVLAWDFDGAYYVLDVSPNPNPPVAIKPDWGDVTHGRFTDDGNRIVLWGGSWDEDDSVARILDRWTGNPVTEVEMLHTGAVFGADVSHDSSLFMGWGIDGRISVFSTVDGHKVAERQLDQSSQLASAFFDANRAWIWTVSGNAVNVWDAQSMMPLVERYFPHKNASSVHVTKSGQQVITYGYDSTIRVWATDVYGSQEILAGSIGPGVVDAVVNSDRSRLFAWDEQITGWLLDTETGATLEQFTDPAGFDGAQFSSADSSLITWMADATVNVWKPEVEPRLTHSVISDCNLRTAAINSTGTKIATTGMGGARLWDAETGSAVIGAPQLQPAYQAPLFSPQGSLVLTWTSGGEVTAWNADNGARLHQQPMVHPGQCVSGYLATTIDEGCPNYEEIVIEANRVLGPQSPKPECSTVEPTFVGDGSQLLTSGRDAIQLWNVETGVAQYPEAPVHESLEHVQVNDTVNRVLSWGGDIINIWDLSTGRPLLEDGIYVENLYQASLSPNGRYVAGMSNNRIDVFDLSDESGARISRLMHDRPMGLAFSADGERIASFGEDGIVRVWGTNSGSEIVEAYYNEQNPPSDVHLNAQDDSILVWGKSGVQHLDIRYETDIAASELARQVEVRTGTRLAATGELLFLSPAEWQAIER